MSEMTVGATGPYAASPNPIRHRIRNSAPNVVASPDPPLARLQMTTPTPISSHRLARSASHPNTGDTHM